MSKADKLLVVDDEQSIRDLLREIFEGEGYAVRTANDAFEALDMIKNMSFDLVITDIRMPGMSGIELVKESSKIKPDIIYIIITGYASLDSAQKAVKYGAYDYLSKPFDIAHIKLAVSRALERKRLFDENARLKEISKLFNLTESISSTLEIDNLSELIFNSAFSQTNSDAGFLLLLDQDETEGGKMVPRVNAGNENPELLLPIALEELCDKALNLLKSLKKPVVITSTGFQEELPERVAHIQDLEGEWMKPPYNQMLLVPLSRMGKFHSILLLFKAGGQSFSRENVDLVSIIAGQGAVAFENTGLITDLKEAYISMIESLILIVEAKDTYTYGHSRRVSNLCINVARKMRLSEREVSSLKLAASLHDIGKISIPETILNKEGPPDQEEWEYIKRHTMIADEVLKPLKFLDEAREIIRSHHERFDGKGYPRGLKGGEIPILTRILAVADAYDAMSSIRAYRSPLQREDIKKELEKNSGKQFDPEVVSIIIGLIDEDKEATI